MTAPFFASDNSGPVHPDVLAALARGNAGHVLGYGDDALTASVVARMRALFEAPEAAVYLVATGTAANSLALASVMQPWETVFCSRVAHIHEDECNAPEFYTGGKLTLVGEADKMTPDTLRAAIEAEGNRGVHGPQRGPVSITNVTERGNVYDLAEIRALTEVATAYGLPVHLDGARFANACVALGCTPAEMTWKAGVDVAVFGGTKNGLMGAEAVILFDPARAQEFEFRRKRAGHLFSKHRYLAAQFDAYLKGDLWREMAGKANAVAALLAEGLRAAGAVVENDARANMLFVTMPRRAHLALFEAGAVYHLWGPRDGDLDAPVTGRLVCDWSQGPAEVAAFLQALAVPGA